MLTTGVDIVHIPRVEAALKRHGERFIRRVFTPREVAASHGFSHELAARFAAKEAVAKALGTGIGLVSWKDIEICRAASGEPILNLLGTAKRLATEQGLETWSISLSHTQEHAIAFVVAMGWDD